MMYGTMLSAHPLFVDVMTSMVTLYKYLFFKKRDYVCIGYMCKLRTRIHSHMMIYLFVLSKVHGSSILIYFGG